MNKIALQSRQRCIPLAFAKNSAKAGLASVLQAASFEGLTRASPAEYYARSPFRNSPRAFRAPTMTKFLLTTAGVAAVLTLLSGGRRYQSESF